MRAEHYNAIRVDIEYAFQQLHPIRNETSKEQDRDRADRAIHALARLMGAIIEVRDEAVLIEENSMMAIHVQPSAN